MLVPAKLRFVFVATVFALLFAFTAHAQQSTQGPLQYSPSCAAALRYGSMQVCRDTDSGAWYHWSYRAKGGRGAFVPDASATTVVNFLSYGVCDGATDQTANLQAAITASEGVPNVGLGEVDIPATCNGTPNSSLFITGNVTLPKNVKLVGLGGLCYPGNVNCVTIQYGGTGIAISTTDTNGTGMENIAIENSGSGTIGLNLVGASYFYGKGLSVYGGFSTAGIEIDDSSTSSSIYNTFLNTSSLANAVGLVLNSTHSGKSVNQNSFTNGVFTQSTGAENIHLTGPANENVFNALDMSHGSTQAPATIGIAVDANSGRDTILNGVTAEGLGTVFNIGANVYNFVANGVDGGFFNSTNGIPITADPTAIYSICWGVYGNQAAECDQSANYINRMGYAEISGQEHPAGQLGLGNLQNLYTQSEAIDNAAWTKVNAPAQTIGTGATAPNGQATANTVTLNGNDNGTTGCGGGPCDAKVRENYNFGSSIQNVCFTESEWFKLDSASVGTPPPYWEMRMSDTNDANGMIQNYPLTSSWQRGTVTNCFPASTQSHVLGYSVYTTAANNKSAQNGVIVDVWGQSLKQTSGMGPYLQTAATAQAAKVYGMTMPLLNFNFVYSGSGAAAVPAAGGLPHARVCVSDAAACTNGTTYAAGGGSVACELWSDGTNWKESGSGC